MRLAASAVTRPPSSLFSLPDRLSRLRDDGAGSVRKHSSVEAHALQGELPRRPLAAFRRIVDIDSQSNTLRHHPRKLLRRGEHLRAARRHVERECEVVGTDEYRIDALDASDRTDVVERLPPFDLRHDVGCLAE